MTNNQPKARPDPIPGHPDEAWIVMPDTPMGPLLIGANAKGVFAIEFDKSERLEKGTRRAVRADEETQNGYQGRRLAFAAAGAATQGSSEAQAHARAAQRQLDEYFAGRRTGFDLDLFLTGTDFEERVWRELVKIPHGETRTYAQIALAAGRPGAARAAGGAIGRNPAAIVVPCHRVVGSSGSLTGFGGGLGRKRWLLDHESGARRLPASAI